jgi:hypothetical protein
LVARGPRIASAGSPGKININENVIIETPIRIGIINNKRRTMYACIDFIAHVSAFMKRQSLYQASKQENRYKLLGLTGFGTKVSVSPL